MTTASAWWCMCKQAPQYGVLACLKQGDPARSRQNGQHWCFCNVECGIYQPKYLRTGSSPSWLWVLLFPPCQLHSNLLQLYRCPVHLILWLGPFQAGHHCYTFSTICCSCFRTVHILVLGSSIANQNHWHLVQLFCPTQMILLWPTFLALNSYTRHSGWVPAPWHHCAELCAWVHKRSQSLSLQE